METWIHDRFLGPPTRSREQMTINIRGKYLRWIATSSGETTIEFMPGMARTDVNPNTLYTLGMVQVKDRNHTIIKNWVFDYDYSVGRLTLRSVQERIGSDTQPPYRFAYYGGTLPAPLSSAQDHWGFYNNNPKPTLIPATAAFRADATRIELDGADRSPTPELLTVGMLKTITYPTGGSDRFKFEPHDYSFEQNRKLVAEVTKHMEVSGYAPAFDTPPGDEHIESDNFTLLEMTDLQLVASFGYGCKFGCGAYLPAVRIEKSTGEEVFHLSLFGAADPDGEPTSKTHVATIDDVPAGQYTFIVSARVPPPVIGNNSVAARLAWEEGTGEYITLRKKGGGVRVAKTGQSHQLTRVPWVYHSCFYSVTDPFHFITPELG